jgi:hypothetical protein
MWRTSITMHSVVSSLMLLAGISCVSSSSTTITKACDPPTAEDAVRTGKRFERVIKLSPFGDGRFWYLQDHLEFYPHGKPSEIVPKGFVTDFASIPAVL